MKGRERKLRIAIAILSLIGVGIATYVTIVDFMGGVPACATGGHGCATVANSSYARMLGVPISAFGVGGYVGILGTAFLRGDTGRLGGFVLALIGVSFSAYLTYLELFVIDAICQWCVGSAVVMTALFVLCTWRLYGSMGRASDPR